MRQGRKTMVVAGAMVTVAVVGGAAAYTMFGDGPGTSPVAGERSATPSASQEPSPPSAAETAETAGAFLLAWSDGDLAAASALTDDPSTALTALDDFAEHTKLAEITVTEGAPSGTSVPFTVDARIAFQDIDAEWTYASELTVVRAENSGEPVVAWEQRVLHPELTEGRRLETGPADDAPPVKALDRHGAELTARDYPVLTKILAELSERYGKHAGGSAAVELRIVDAEGELVEQLMELSEPTASEVPTTIDPAIQRAAEAALKDTKHAALVAVQPSTGEIRAVVNSPADGFDTALQGSYAPGSTWKVVTAGMLIDDGLAAHGKAHPCPQYFEHGGWKFQNLNETEIEGGTFTDSFAASCNTAFISTAPELADDQLGSYARSAFGIGLDWQVGVPSMDGTVPVEADAQMAAQLIGQAGVRVSPMVMASVSATVKTGEFRQPHLVPPSFDDRELARAAGPSAEAAQQLRQLMNATATRGTAAEAMAGLTGDLGGKTGSAEVMDQEKPNAWFTAYRNDLAVAAVVPSSGHGGKIAGPLVAQVLRAAP